MKKKTRILFVLLFFVYSLTLLSCNDIIGNITGNIQNKEINVMFIVDDNLYHRITLTEGEMIQKPVEPTKEGYEFKGWFLDYELTQEFTFDKILKGDNIILYAKFTKKETGTNKPSNNYWTVTFYVDGNVYNSQTVIEYDNFVIPAEPTKEGYEFKGWSWNGNMLVGSIMVTQNIELYAVFEKIENSPTEIYYNVSYYVDGTLFRTDKVLQNSYLYYREAPKKEGYEFKGWSWNGNMWDYNWVVTQDMILIASYEENSQPVEKYYTVTYYIDGVLTQTEKVKEYSCITEPENPVKDGYKFIGWTYKGYIWNFNQDVKYDLELHAEWEVIYYTIDYQEAYNSSGMSNPNMYYSYTVEDEIIILDGYKEGYEFIGWYSDPMYQNKVTKIEKGTTGNITLYPYLRETQQKTYYITYVFEFSDVANGNMESYLEGELFSLADPYKEGYEFKGWYLDPNYLIPVATFGPSGDMTLYGKFERIEESLFAYTECDDYVIIDGYNGYDSVIDIPEYINEKPVYIINDYAFKGCNFTKVNLPNTLESIGYKAFEDCYNLEYLIIPSNVYKLDNSFGDYISFNIYFESYNAYSYYEWEDKAYLYSEGAWSGKYWCYVDGIPTPVSNIYTYTVNFYVDDVIYQTEIYSHEAFITPPTEPTKEGYTFVGWYYEEYEFMWDFNMYTVIYDMTLTAVFEEICLFTYNEYIDAVEITGYIGSESEIEIPSYINNKPVYKVSGFNDNSTIVSIKFPESVRDIESYSFNNLANLRYVELPKYLTGLGLYTFYNCPDLQTVVIFQAFQYTYAGAFDMCSKLYQIYYDGNLDQWASISWCDSKVIESCRLYLYSEQEPEVFGYFWHYVDGNVTNWVATYNVTFMVDGEVYSTCQVNKDNMLNLYNYPNKTNYSFKYWIDEDGQVFSQPQTGETIRDLVLTAVYTKIYSEEYSLYYYTYDSYVEISNYNGNNNYVILPYSIDGVVVGNIKSGFQSVDTIYYLGTAEQFANIHFDYYLDIKPTYYYAEEQPMVSGNYWHYVDGVPTIWLEYTPFTYYDHGDYLGITGYIGNETDVVVPEYIHAKVVKIIAPNAFVNCGFRSLTIPQTVETIYGGILTGCNNLEVLSIPFIGLYANENMNKLVYLFDSTGMNSDTIPSSLKKLIITNEGFFSNQFTYGDKYIEEIEILSEIEYIDISMLGSYLSLKSVLLPESIKETFLFDDAQFAETDAKIFYQGTKEDYRNVLDGIINIDRVPFYYYSEEEPTETGNYWHYVDGVPTVWEQLEPGFYLIGTNTNWEFDKDYKLNQISDNYYKIEVQLEKEVQFIITNETYTNSYYETNVTYGMGVDGFAPYIRTLVAGNYTIEILNGLLYIYLEDYDTNYQYTESDYFIEITAYFGEGSEIFIPSRINGKQVYTIGENAFLNSNITSVVIPNSVYTINDNAFKNCNNLKYVEIIKGAYVNVGVNVFYGCNNMETMILPFGGKDGMPGNMPGEEYDGVNFGYFFGAHNSNENSQYIPNSLKLVLITDSYQSFYGCFNNVTINTIGIMNFNRVNEEYFTGSDFEILVLGENTTDIEMFTFETCSIYRIFYEGTEEEFNNRVNIDSNNPILDKIYFLDDGQYLSTRCWHYVNGVPTVWA